MPNVRAHSAFEPLIVSRRTPVFVLTGAGISAESGVRTFRDAGGLWHSYRFEDVASPEAWAKDLFDECRLGTATEAVPELFRVSPKA